MTLAVRAGLVKFALVAGAADSSTAGISVAAEDGTAITANDTIIACIELATSTNDKTDRTVVAAIIAGGRITVPTSTSDVIAVWWLAAAAGQQVSSPIILSGDADGAGGAVATTLTGISTTDILICCVSVHSTTGAWTDQTSDTTISDADEITVANSTTGERIFAIWMDTSGPRGFAAMNVQFGMGNMDASPSDLPSEVTISAIKAEDVPLIVLAFDETDGDLLSDLSGEATITTDGTITIDDTYVVSDPSPTDLAGADLLVFYQKSNDLDT